MSITVLCPSCSSRITAPDRLAGKTAKCSKCRTAFVLPSAELGFEVVEDDEPVVARPKVKPADPDPGFTVVGEDLPKRLEPKKLPRKRIVEVEDDDLPIPRRRPSTGSTASYTRLFILLGGGVALLAAVAGGLYYALGKVPSIPPVATGATPPPSAPAEWKTFAPMGSRFSVSLPGTPVTPNEIGEGDAFGVLGVKMQSWELNGEELEYKLLVLGKTPDPADGLKLENILETLLEQSTERANPDPGLVETPSTLGRYPARQIAYVHGIEHVLLRAAVVGHSAYVFEVVRKNKPIEAGEEAVQKFFDSIAIQ